MATQPLTFITVQEYLDLDRKSELKHDFVDGEVFAMAGGPPAHALIAANLGRELGNRLAGTPCLVFSSDLRVSVDPDRLITYPDVTVVCGQPRYFDEKRDTITNPTLVAEVVSPSTENYDRGKKGYMYRQVGSIKEYLLIAQDHASVECYRPMANGHWELIPNFDIASTVKLESVGIEISMAEIYRGVELLDIASS